MAVDNDECNEKLPGYWELLETESVFNMFDIKDPACSLLKELIFVLKVHVYNDEDKENLSEKIFAILQGKLRRCR